MTMLADRIDAVIGVDTHADTHTAAVVSATGAVLHVLTVPTTEEGYGQLLDALLQFAPGPRVAWAIEGTGSYGTALHRDLHAGGSEVIEIRAVRRARGRNKNDTNDAIDMARTALSQDTHAAPRTGEIREALAIYVSARAADVKTRTRLSNQLKALIVAAEPALRERLRSLSTTMQIRTARTLRTPKNTGPAQSARIHKLREIATQITALTAVIDNDEKRLDKLTAEHAAPLRDIYGVGPINGAQILITFSHPGRFRSHAAFAAIAGTSPLEASSGRTTRHRLNRTGDRQLNAAIHRIVLTRTGKHALTDAYISRRTTEGKTPKEINRCLKRYLTRQLYNLLESMPAMP